MLSKNTLGIPNIARCRIVYRNAMARALCQSEHSTTLLPVQTAIAITLFLQ